MSCIMKKIKTLFINFPNTYTSDLEKFIVSHHPQNVADVEKLMFEYNLRKANQSV
jgi:hypothetical protein